MPSYAIGKSNRGVSLCQELQDPDYERYHQLQEEIIKEMKKMASILANTEAKMEQLRVLAGDLCWGHPQLQTPT